MVPSNKESSRSRELEDGAPLLWMDRQPATRKEASKAAVLWAREAEKSIDWRLMLNPVECGGRGSSATPGRSSSSESQSFFELHKLKDKRARTGRPEADQQGKHTLAVHWWLTGFNIALKCNIFIFTLLSGFRLPHVTACFCIRINTFLAFCFPYTASRI